MGALLLEMMHEPPWIKHPPWIEGMLQASHDLDLRAHISPAIIPRLERRGGIWSSKAPPPWRREPRVSPSASGSNPLVPRQPHAVESPRRRGHCRNGHRVQRERSGVTPTR